MYNRALGGNGWGAAIYTWSDVESYIFNSYIANNYADEAGGAIATASRTKIINCTIVNNTANEMGGGIYVYEEGEGVISTIQAHNNTIYDNYVYEYKYLGLGGMDVYISNVVTRGDLIDFNDNYWGVNNPLNTTEYPYSWADRYKTNNITGNPTSWINLPVQSTLIGNNITLYYKNGTRYSVKLVDNNNDPLENQSITININGVDYNRKTNSDGEASIAINLSPGEYKILTTYNGSNDYAKSSINNTINVLSTIESKNITKYFRNKTQFTATILDGKGNPVVGGNVEFNINGVLYTRKTNTEGIASLNINLNPGLYTITVKNQLDGLLMSYTVNVLSILQGENIVKYFRNETQYSVKVLDDRGNPLNNAKVQFNINGVFYTKTSNNDGIATLNINLNPGEYVITAIFNGCAISNTVNVLSIIESEDLEMTTTSRTPFIVKALDGQGKPYSGGKLSFNINGVIYDRITDSNGLSSLNINLIAGKYIITTIFNELSQSNTITIF